MEYITDEYGKWEANGNFRILYSGNESEEYISAQQTEVLAQLEQVKLDALIPTEEKIRKAEAEIQIITLLQEVGLI